MTRRDDIGRESADFIGGLRHQTKRAMNGAVPVIVRFFGNRGSFLFLAGLIGFVVGGAASLLKWMIGEVGSVFLTRLNVDSCNWWLLAVPVAGVLLTGIFTRYVLRTPVEHGCERLHVDMEKHLYRLQTRLVPGPMLASTLTLGFGGSAGSEGPIAYTGAAVGSNLGRAFNLTDDQLRILIGVGAGAGIAGIFKAPVGGILFTLEVMGLALTTFSVIALIVGCLTSAATAYAFSGYTLDVGYHHPAPFTSEMILPIVALGACCGLYSLWYSFCMSRSQRVIDRISNPWMRNLLSGLFIGAMVFLFPTLYGEGYTTMGQLINGDFSHLLDSSLFKGGDVFTLMWVVAGILAVKGLVVQATNSGGGVAGDFAPTLFSGALAGFLFATFSNTIVGTNLATADFAFFGMAAVMAGTIQAPLMALFLTAEMTGDLAMFLPLMLAAAISYAMVRVCSLRWRYIFAPVWRHHLHRPSQSPSSSLNDNK